MPSEGDWTLIVLLYWLEDCRRHAGNHLKGNLRSEVDSPLASEVPAYHEHRFSIVVTLIKERLGLAERCIMSFACCLISDGNAIRYGVVPPIRNTLTRKGYRRRLESWRKLKQKMSNAPGARGSIRASRSYTP